MSRRSLHSVRERRPSLPQLAEYVTPEAPGFSRMGVVTPAPSRIHTSTQLQRPPASAGWESSLLYLPKRVCEPVELVVEHSSTNPSSEVKRCIWRRNA